MSVQPFASYEHLENYLRKYANFGDDPVPYDFNGVLRLLVALADNLRANSCLDAHIEDIQCIVTPEQAEFLLRLEGRFTGSRRLASLLTGAATPRWLLAAGPHDGCWRLAEDAYEHRVMPAGTLELDRLAVLADALLDAGCTDPDILGHLRGPGPHWRGCHVVDLILGKE